MQIVIVVEALGAGSDSAKAVTNSFKKTEVTVGRNADNDIVLAEPQVSGNHAKLCAKMSSSGKAEIYVTDMGSSNGTYIEDKSITANVETVVPDNKRLIIGNFLLTPTAVAEVKKAEKPVKKVVVPEKAEKKTTSEKGPPATSVRPAVNGADGSKRASLSVADYEKEIEIKHQIHELLIQRLDLRRKDIAALSDIELRNRARNVVEEVLVELRWELPDGLEREPLIKEVLDEALGLGPLEELLADDNVSEIMVNNYKQIYAETGGRLALTDHRFSSEQAVLGAIERIISPIGRRIDESSPLVDARLKDGSRVNAVIRPLALAGPCITIRKFSKEPLTIDDLVRFGSLSQGMADFLKLAIGHRLNTVISGGTGSGKTTLLNVISGFIPDTERVITVEDAAELQLPQEHVVSFETRPPNLEGKGAINIRDLVKNALRMRPDRIIVGECRGAEALDMLQAMNTGHDGSMTTGHANAPEDMMRRLETMVLTAGLDIPVRAVREQIGSAVDIVIQQTRFGCGTRKVTAITEVIGMDYDEGVVQMQDIFLFRQSGYDENSKIRGVHQATGYIPKFFRSLQERGLPVDANVFSPDE